MRSLLALRQNMSCSGSPPPPERHAIIDQSPAERDLHLFEAAQAGVDVPARPLERPRQGHRVSSRLGGGAGRVRPDNERRIAKKAYAGDYRARRDHVDDCLQKRLGRCGHQGRQYGMHFAPGEVPEVADRRVRRTAERKRGVVLAPVAIDQDAG